jgi:hypothetical protein
MHVEAGLRNDAVGIVELGNLRQMTDVAGVIIKDGFAGMALIRPTASSSVPSALGLAGLSKPT